MGFRNSKYGNRVLSLLLVMACIVLIFLHGIEKEGSPLFKVDAITIGLLVLCFIPLLQQLVDSIKAGGVEVQFREYAMHKQIFIFLDGIAAKQAWTFYTPRKDEILLGHGFSVLIDWLLKNKRKELVSQLTDWLESENDNRKWFAAEVIGYAKIEELKDECKAHFEKLDLNECWERWELNCLWAYSRFFDYKPLTSKLQEMKNESNQKWIVAACKQMIDEENDINVKNMLQDVVESFPQYNVDSTARC